LPSVPNDICFAKGREPSWAVKSYKIAKAKHRERRQGAMISTLFIPLRDERAKNNGNDDMIRLDGFKGLKEACSAHVFSAQELDRKKPERAFA
jgi:hypothetical protein